MNKMGIASLVGKNISPGGGSSTRLLLSLQHHPSRNVKLVNDSRRLAIISSLPSSTNSLNSDLSITSSKCTTGPVLGVKFGLCKRGESVGLSSVPLAPPTLFKRTSQLATASLSVQGTSWTRNLHLSSTRSHPRFKLSLERKSDVEKAVETSEADDDKQEEDENQSFLKSHPYRQLCTWRSKSELAEVLIKNQITNDHGLFVTNKPFGVGVKNPPTHKNVYGDSQQLHLRGLKLSPYTLEAAIPDLRHLLNKPNLVLVKSTEKLSSGVAVFADDEEIATRFSKALVSSKFHYNTMYKYHVITTLPPMFLNPDVPFERIGLLIKTPLGSDKGQPFLERLYSNRAVKRQDVKSIHAQTKLLKRGYNDGCLVEIGTSSVQHNFLRVHCADKLSPLLGDNLYSDRVRMLNGVPAKIDPTHLSPGTTFQKLSVKMIDLLDLKTPENAIIIPAHIHLRSYKVRQFIGKGAEIELEAPYPRYFKWTCDQLGMPLYEEPV